jgi:hypothetical protein
MNLAWVSTHMFGPHSLETIMCGYEISSKNIAVHTSPNLPPPDTHKPLQNTFLVLASYSKL